MLRFHHFEESDAGRFPMHRRCLTSRARRRRAKRYADQPRRAGTRISSGLKIKKRFHNATVTTSEYICGCATVDNAHVLLLGVYRPASEAVIASSFSELIAVLEQRSTYRCPIVVCGDLNIHVDG